MKVVIALGGNALAPPGLEQAETQRAAARHAAEAIAGIAREHDVVVTHGIGPQVGLLAAQAEAAGQGVPLDVLGAESDHHLHGARPPSTFSRKSSTWAPSPGSPASAYS